MRKRITRAVMLKTAVAAGGAALAFGSTVQAGPYADLSDWTGHDNAPPYSAGTTSNNNYTVTNTSSTVPVEIRSSGLHGTGNLSWFRAACTAGECPPFQVGGSSANLNGSVTSSQEAGFLNMSGPAPIIR